MLSIENVSENEINTSAQLIRFLSDFEQDRSDLTTGPQSFNKDSSDECKPVFETEPGNGKALIAAAFSENEPQPSVRVLPHKRIREHVAIKSCGKWFPLSNDVITSAMNHFEFAVFSKIVGLGPNQHPNRRELLLLVGGKYQNMLAALESLKSKGVLFNDVVSEGRHNEKDIWHIASPRFWRLDNFPCLNFQPGEIDPFEWVPRSLEAPLERIDEYSKAARANGHFLMVPRFISKLDLSSSSLRLWMYIASLRETWHPTIDQIANQIDLNESTVRRNLKILIDKRMIVATSYRHTKFSASAEKVYHVTHPALWDFPEADSYDAPSFSILHDPDFIKSFAQPGERKQTTGRKETNNRAKGNKQPGERKQTTGQKETTSTNESLALHGIDAQNSPCENVLGEKNHSENSLSDDVPKKMIKKSSSLSGADLILKEDGSPSSLICRLVADYVECAFERNKKGQIYYARLNEWIAEFAGEAASKANSFEEGLSEARKFCEFIQTNFARAGYRVKKGAFEQLEGAWAKAQEANKIVEAAPEAEEHAETHSALDNPVELLPSPDVFPVAAEAVLMPTENTFPEVQNTTSEPVCSDEATVASADEEVAPETQNTPSEPACDKEATAELAVKEITKEAQNTPSNRRPLSLVPKLDKTNPTAIWVQIKKKLGLSNQLSTKYAVYLMKRGNTFEAMDQLAAEDQTFGQAYRDVMAS